MKAVAPKPVNLLVGIKSETLTVAELSAAGVKRISVGSRCYTHVAAYSPGRRALAQGDIADGDLGNAFLRSEFTARPGSSRLSGGVRVQEINPRNRMFWLKAFIIYTSHERFDATGSVAEFEPDILTDGLDVVFCGLNFAASAVEDGYHFSHRNNRFWPVLHLAGFTDVRLAAGRSTSAAGLRVRCDGGRPATDAVRQRGFTG